MKNMKMNIITYERVIDVCNLEKDWAMEIVINELYNRLMNRTPYYVSDELFIKFVTINITSESLINRANEIRNDIVLVRKQKLESLKKIIN